MRGELIMTTQRKKPPRSVLTPVEKKKCLAALNKVLKHVGSKYRMAKMLDVSIPLVFAWFNGVPVAPIHVPKLVKMSEGETKPSDFRPDIYYVI